MAQRIKRALALLVAVLTLFGTATALFSCSSFDSGDVIMEYKGHTFTEGMYMYWLSTWKEYYVNYYSDVEDKESFWQAESSLGVTNEEYLTDIILTRIKYYLIAQELFDEFGLVFSKSDSKTIENEIKSQIEYYGTKSSYNAFLSNYKMDITTLKKLYVSEAKFTAVYNYLYNAENGVESSSGDELDAYYKTYYNRVKYIAIFKNKKYLLDEDGNRMTDFKTGYYQFVDLTDAEKKANKEQIEALFERAESGENFDTLIKESMPFYDAESYPNGFYITADDYMTHTAAVTDAAISMEAGEVKLVENDDSYFLIKKYTLIEGAYLSDTDLGQFSNLVEYSNNEKFSKKFSALAEGVKSFDEVISRYSLSKIK